jgi:hypothetical protein
MTSFHTTYLEKYGIVKALRIMCTDCFGYPLADIEETLSTYFFDIAFLNCKSSDLEPKIAEIVHFHIPSVQFV